MVDVAQLVRASLCGSEGRGFKSRHPPLAFSLQLLKEGVFFLAILSNSISLPYVKVIEPKWLDDKIRETLKQY